MSFDAMLWALRARAPSGAAKLLLIAMAELARPPAMEAFASAQTLSETTQQDRKTVLSNLKRLEEAGLVRRLDKRTGLGGAPVFQLAMPDVEAAATDTKSGTASDKQGASEPIPVFPQSSTSFPAKRSQFSREAVPNLGHKPVRTSTEPVLNQEKRARPKALASTSPMARPDDVAQQVWTDWLRLRKEKRAAVTTTVLDGARGEATKAGMSLEAFLRVWCFRGSQGLQADWLKPHELEAGRRGQSGSAAPNGARQQAEFAQMNYTEGLTR